MQRPRRRRISSRAKRRISSRANAESAVEPNAESAFEPDAESAARPGAESGTGQDVTQQTVSAEQLISVLEQEPSILESIRSFVAQRSGADSAAITDEMIFERIRQDAGLRELVTKRLIASGYGPNFVSLNEAPRAGSTDQLYRNSFIRIRTIHRLSIGRVRIETCRRYPISIRSFLSWERSCVDLEATHFCR